MARNTGGMDGQAKAKANPWRLAGSAGKGQPSPTAGRGGCQGSSPC